jgi:phosphate:Na+ symporter
MNIFGLLNIILGLALFLYGLEIMGKSLAAVSGRQLPPRFRALGAVVVVWLFGLAGTAGQNPHLMFLRPSAFAPLFAAAGIVLFISAKSIRRKNVGQIPLSFAMALLGLSFVTENIQPLFAPAIHVFSNPLLWSLIGAALCLLLLFWDKLKRLLGRHNADNMEKPAAKDTAAIAGLDARFLATPTFALGQARSAAIDMAGYAKETVALAVDLLFSYEKKKGERVVELEEAVDQYEDQVGAYLLKIGAQQLSPKDSHALAVLLHAVNDIERVSDLALSIKKSAKEMKDKDLRFGEATMSELKILTNAVNDVVNTSFLAFQEEDQRLAKMVEPLAAVIDSLRDKIRKNQVKQLRKGLYTAERGFICNDIIASCEGIASHSANLALGMLQSEDSYETHEYSRLVRLEDNGEFANEVKRLKKLYKI